MSIIRYRDHPLEEREEKKVTIKGIIRSKEEYQAALNEEWEEFMGDFGMHPMTLARDTAIHMVVHSNSKKILEQLLGGSPFMEEHYMMTNDYGNTALHMAAMTGNIEAVELLVSSSPNLLEIHNNVGETPLFKAAAFGWTKIVKFLASEPDQIQCNMLLPIHRQRLKDPTDPIGTSILHIAVQGEHFDTALELLRLDESLGQWEDKNDMTCLQLLANMPSAFKSGYRMSILKSIVYFCLPIFEDDDVKGDNTPAHIRPANDLEGGLDRNVRDDDNQVPPRQHDSLDDHQGKKSNSDGNQVPVGQVFKWIILSFWSLWCLGLPKIERIWEAKKKHKFAFQVAKMLIKEDYSWILKHTTIDSSLYYSSVGAEEDDEKENKTREFALKLAKLLMKEDISCEYQLSSPQDQTQSAQEERQDKSQPKTHNITETPLLLATRHGILEIFEEILKVYPQAVEHCGHMGQNILHVAVKHRQKEIFDHVKDMKIPMSTLVRGIDKNGYTILHHAAELDKKGTRPGPALQLQAELKWFKRVQKQIPTHYARHVDGKGRTANSLFKENHEEQLKKAQKWIKETSQSCSAVAVLIATVVFAAAYTLPGGSNDNGIPVFLNSPFFLFFTIMDVVSLASSLTSVVMFLSILTSPCEQKDFLHSLPRKLTIGFTLLFFSVATTMLAFAATIVLIIRLNQKQWTTTLIYVAAFFPVTVFALMQFPLYAAFMGTSKGSFKKFSKFVSRFKRRIISKAKHILN